MVKWKQKKQNVLSTSWAVTDKRRTVSLKPAVGHVWNNSGSSSSLSLWKPYNQILNTFKSQSQSNSLVALSHRILRWARFVWAPSHQLRTHWCHLPRSVQARSPQGLFPSGFYCQSFCSAAAGHHQRLASPRSLQGAKGYKAHIH